MKTVTKKEETLIKYYNGDKYIGGGHLGLNEPVGYKYLHKKQTLLKSPKKSVKKENKK